MQITISQPLIASRRKIPVYQLADYLSTECRDIWALQGKSTETNPLLLTRAMDLLIIFNACAVASASSPI
ncbi:hypothetical protein ACNKHW_16205 [Shigella flexneri]